MSFVPCPNTTVKHFICSAVQKPPQSVKRHKQKWNTHSTSSDCVLYTFNSWRNVSDSNTDTHVAVFVFILVVFDCCVLKCFIWFMAVVVLQVSVTAVNPAVVSVNEGHKVTLNRNTWSSTDDGRFRNVPYKPAGLTVYRGAQKERFGRMSELLFTNNESI